MCICLYSLLLHYFIFSFWDEPVLKLVTLSLNGRRIAPTILLDVPQDSLIMSEEIFGPLLPILTVSAELLYSSAPFFPVKKV